MPRGFTEARALFGYLLDRHESGVASPIGYPDYSGCADVVAMDRFNRELRDAEGDGAVRLAMGRGRNSEDIAHVRLVAPARLYALLERRPIGERADAANNRLLDGLCLSPEFEPALQSLRKAWAQGRSWQGFALDDVDRLRPAFILAQAILEGRHRGVDYRTFSRRTAGDSKALERMESVVVRLLSSTLELPPTARPRDALRTLGLEKFAPPLLLSGPLDFDRPWDSITDDQLALLDHLGVDKFMVMGFCIGGPLIWNLLKRAPNRVIAGVLAQPSGSRPEARNLFYETNTAGWAVDYRKRNPSVTAETIDKFLTKMYRNNPDFVFTVTRDFVKSCQTPVLILPDDIPAHPYAVAMEAAMLAPKAEASIFPWKQPKERIPLAVRQIRSFLKAHRPA